MLQGLHEYPVFKHSGMTTVKFQLT